jgi:hypothetical protein
MLIEPRQRHQVALELIETSPQDSRSQLFAELMNSAHHGKPANVEEREPRAVHDHGLSSSKRNEAAENVLVHRDVRHVDLTDEVHNP